MSNLTSNHTRTTRRTRILERSELREALERLASLVLTRHLLFIIATAVVLLLYGYHFGTYDQVIHLPSLKKFADPSLYPGDAFMELRFQHYSYFWLLFVPFYKLGVLEVSMFFTYLAVTYLTFWSIWLLSDTLFHNWLTNMLSVIILTLPKAAFGGWTVFEFSLLNRTFVLPFLLLAITLYLKRRYLLAFALVGLIFNLHALSANFVVAMFLLDAVRRWRTVGLGTLLRSVGIFLVTALPVLVWRIVVPGSGPLMDPEWLSIIAHGILSNTYYMFAPFPYIWVLTASGVGTLLLYGIAHHALPRAARNPVIDNFMLALGFILIMQVVTVQWFPVTVVIEAQLIRAGVWTLIFGCLYFANYLVYAFQSKRQARIEVGLQAVALAFPFAFVPVIVWALGRVIKSRVAYRLVTLGGLTAAFGLSVVLANGLGVWYPGVYVYPHQTPWYDVQIWARDHTPRDARFITPPQQWSYHESDWRVFSERTTVVSMSELMEIAFAPNYLQTWRERMDALAPAAVEQFDGNALENGAFIERAYYSLSDQALLNAACKYGASYMVSEKPHLRTFPLVYENEDFVVYALPLNECSSTAQ